MKNGMKMARRHEATEARRVWRASVCFVPAWLRAFVPLLWLTGSVIASDAPNLLLFLVDDLGWQDVSVPMHTETTPFNERYRTPHLERLAARGMRFTDAYASAPVCTPTRTSILTGQSPGRTGITYWILNKDKDTSREHPRLRPPTWRLNGLDESDTTLPRLLRDRGYRTIHAGKAHFGAHGTSGSDPTRLGFDVNIAGHASGAPSSYYGEHAFSAAGKRGEPDGKPSVWDVPGLEKYHGEAIYLTEALAVEAAAAVRAAVSEDRPFFLYFAPYAVHTPIMANRRYLDRYADLPSREAAYATMIESVDAALGVLIEELTALGVLQQTVVVFTSDNGGLSAHARDGERHTHNAPLKSGKGSAYEGGVRAPTVMCWPDVTVAGSTCSTPVVSQDLFPTLLAIAGVDRPGDLRIGDGRDLGPLLRGQADFDAERVIGFHQPHQWGVTGPGIEPFTAIRSGRWKLIYFHDGPRFELYDLQADIGEQNDLAPSQPERVREMAQRMDAWIEDAGVKLSIDKETREEIAPPGEAVR